MNQKCSTCFFGRFEKTPTGRIKKNIAGRCVCPDPEPEHFPQSMWDGMCAGNPHGEPPVLSRHAVWPNFGKVCPKWVPCVELESIHNKCFPLGAP